MKKIIGITVAGLLVYMALAFASATKLAPSGTPRWVLVASLWVLGIIAAAVVVWFLSRRAKQDGQPAGQSEPAAQATEIDLLVRAAEAKLVSARAGHIGSLPAILLIGEPGSTKTTTILHSGLEPELLAGQVQQDANVVPTQPLTSGWLDAS